MAYARLLTRNTSGLHPNLRGLGFLGDSPGLTPTAALQQAIALYSGKHLNQAQFQDQTWLQDAENAIQTATIPITGGFGPQCAGIAAQPVNLFQTASGLALGTTSAGIGILASTTVIAATTAAIAGAITMGVGVIIAVIDLIFAHHAAAVKRDLNFGCSVWPAVNNAFQLIATAVQNNQMSPANAAALPEIYSQVMSAGGASGTASGPGNIPSGGTSINDSPYCNSNCELSVVLLGMVFFWQSNYQALAAEQQAGEQAAVSRNSSTHAIVRLDCNAHRDDDGPGVHIHGFPHRPRFTSHVLVTGTNPRERGGSRNGTPHGTRRDPGLGMACARGARRLGGDGMIPVRNRKN